VNRKDVTAIRGSRIVVFLHSLELGGSERQALLLARYLKREGADVEVWALRSPGKAARLCEDYGIPWRLVPLAFDSDGSVAVSALKLVKLFRESKTDIILSYLICPNVLCGLSWRLSGARLFVWNQRNPGTEAVTLKVARGAAFLTKRFAANSDEGALFLEASLGVKRHRVRVIRNGVELAEPKASRAEWRRFLGIDESTFLACMVANLSSYKDHRTLLTAWRRVLEKSVASAKPVLALAGRFDDAHQALVSLSRELQIDQTVRFLGMVDDVPGLLKAADLAVFSSRAEGCPNGVIECMASGLAVVGTDIPGIRDVVAVSAYPFLVPIGDADSLSDRIIQLAVSPALRTRLGEANRQRAVTEFNLQNMCDKTVQFIKECMT